MAVQQVQNILPKFVQQLEKILQHRSRHKRPYQLLHRVQVVLHN